MLSRMIFSNTGRLALCLLIGLTLLGFAPAPIKAAPNPVDLELGGTGATAWNMVNVKPGNSGTVAVELRNIGSEDGFVTIWVSDIISSEGLNPEAETGDTAEPGELGEYLKLGLTGDGLSTSVDLPTTIDNLPHSATEWEYVEVTPLKVGSTVDLQWAWELPASAGNEIQGDSLSFNINYLLRECSVLDVSGIVTADGAFTQEVTVNSESSAGTLTISQGTVAETAGAQPLTDIWLIEIDKESLPPPPDKAIIGSMYDGGPDGTTFDQPITITINYDPADIPIGVGEGALVIGLWDRDAGEWVTLSGCVVDTVNHTISAQISHFSRYTVIAPVPVPASGGEEMAEEEEPTTSGRLEIDMLARESIVEIGADGVLGLELSLTDPDGNFTIDIGAGTKITSLDGAALSRLELRLADEPIAVLDNIVVLSPAYQLTGYDRNMNITEISFTPPARLAINYDPQHLPENSYLPFVASYTEAEGLAPLLPLPEALVTVGVVEAQLSHSALLVAAVEVAPPQPPLPAEFEASSLTINPQSAYAGETVTISLTITNEGAVAGIYELHLIIDGIVRAVKEVTLTGESSETLTFTVSNLAAGSHQVKVAGLTGRFEVIRVAASPAEMRVNWLILDLSVIAALLVSGIALYFIIRRSRRADLS